MQEAHGNNNASQRIQELRDSLKTIQSEGNKLQTEYYNLKKQRNQVRNEISKLVAETRQIRKTRDNITAEVKAEKEKRGELNTHIKEKITSIHIIPLKKGEKNPSQIKHSMNLINQKIETEVISFEKEKELMKILHKLKKEYDAAMKIQEEYMRKKEASAEINTLKKDSDKIHVDIQEKAKLSQEQHEKSVTNSKKIDELVKTADELTKTIEQKEKTLTELETKLNTQLNELNSLTGEEKQKEEFARQQKRDSIHKTIAQKKAEVEEKLKRGEKLTTQDILVMQSD